jgi:hypothetical protein
MGGRRKGVRARAEAAAEFGKSSWNGCVWRRARETGERCAGDSFMPGVWSRVCVGSCTPTSGVRGCERVRRSAPSRCCGRPCAWWCLAQRARGRRGCGVAGACTACFMRSVVSSGGMLQPELTAPPVFWPRFSSRPNLPCVFIHSVCVCSFAFGVRCFSSGSAGCNAAGAGCSRWRWLCAAYAAPLSDGRSM